MPEQFAARYAQLNDQQRQAVDTIEGPVLVIAGPGSGKTELLSLRVANILRRTDVQPRNILCLTFTDAAAANMRERLAGLIGPEAYRVAIHTFHSFGADIINRHPGYFYQGATVSPVDDIAQIEILSELIEALPHNNPLRSRHPSEGYVYLRAIRSHISALKKSGLTPEEFSAIIEDNTRYLTSSVATLTTLFDQRISKQTITALEQWLATTPEPEALPVPQFSSLGAVIRGELAEAVRAAQEQNSTKPITAWKGAWLGKDDAGHTIIRDARYGDHMRTLADIYRQYQSVLHERGYYDFDDMLLDVITALSHHDALHYDLQEQYLYILIDEFQDTNDAQTRLVQLLTDNPASEQQPNVMAVGDDDQAIFKFQGAEIANIIGFHRRYREPAIIALTRNYRSRAAILTAARAVITQGTHRLENILPDISKELTADGVGEGEGQVIVAHGRTALDEYHYVAECIGQLLATGTAGHDIAVITSKHDNLAAIARVLEQHAIPVAYERRSNVLQQPHIEQLLVMMRAVDALARNDLRDASAYLGVILQYPFWGLERQAIWQIAQHAHRTHQPWLDVMLHAESVAIRQMADLFLRLAHASQSEPAEHIIAELIGASAVPVADSDEEDAPDEPQAIDRYISPFKSFYFSPHVLRDDPRRYVNFLSALRSLVAALRQFRHGLPLKLTDALSLIDLYQHHQLTLTDTGLVGNQSTAVCLMTVHKAKGLEFASVFVTDCQDKTWTSSRRDTLPLPRNLPITASSEDDDDYIRLLYVALTRAKRQLTISWHDTSENGRPLLPLSLIGAISAETVTIPVSSNLDHQLHSILDLPTPTARLTQDEQHWLRPVIENYYLSATHLTNFLNVTDGGPRAFFEHNLLRFPEPKSASQSYGTAIHAALNYLYSELQTTASLPTVDRVIEHFDYCLRRERLSDRELTLYRAKGSDVLTRYLRERSTSFATDHLSEYDFRHEGVCVGDARLTGKIDKLVRGDREITVYDFKTGGALERWDPTDNYAKVKAWKYRRQLLFYKLLVEHSRSFDGKFSVNKGVISFVEPYHDRLIELALDIDSAEIEHLTRVITAVWHKIANLDFPDVSHYPSTIEGIEQFENDLIA